MSARALLIAFYAPSAAPAPGGSLKEFSQSLSLSVSDPATVVGDKKAAAVANKYFDAADALAASPADAQAKLASLEKEIEAVVYVLPGSSDPTAADLALFSALYPIVASSGKEVQHAYPSLTRYTAHIASLPAVRAAAAKAALSVPQFTPIYEGLPKIQRVDPAKEKAEKAKAKEAKAAAAGTPAQGPKEKKDKEPKTEGPTAAAAAPASGEGKKEKKEKKEKAPKQPKAPAAPARLLPSFVDLRVGKIVDVQRHPDADSLYLEKIDFGEGEPRVILSGLVKFVPMEQMKDRMIVGVCNLKPVSMRGIKSHGMVLCATSKDGHDAGVEPVFPPAGAAPGDRVYVEGYKGLEPEAQMNPKKKIFETIQPGYLTTDNKICAWKGVGPDEDPTTAEPKVRVLQTDKGPVYAATFAGATLS